MQKYMKDGIKKEVTMYGACDSFSTEYALNCVSSECDFQYILKTRKPVPVVKCPMLPRKIIRMWNPPSRKMTERRGLSS